MRDVARVWAETSAIAAVIFVILWMIGVEHVIEGYISCVIGIAGGLLLIHWRYRR